MDEPHMIKKIINRVVTSRYGWFLQGLPDLAKSKAMFSIRRNTMTTPIRCGLLWDMCKRVLTTDVEGDFVECGVWKGGSAGMMGLAIKKFDQSRKRNLHLFDSFEGLPQPRIEDGIKAADYSGGVSAGELTSVHQCEAGIDIVRDLLIGKLGLPKEQIVFHEGWFQNTIPNLGHEPRKIGVLRLDGDWYESTKVCLEHLYDRVSPGGVVILDDYFCWEGCRKATDEFRAARNIQTPIVRIDVDAGYWVKSA